MVHPELLDFQRRLESVGIVTALHSDHVCVRLPLLTSVRVRYDGERLTFDPRSGAVPRTRGTVITYFAALVAVAPTVITGVAPSHIVGIATLAVMAGIIDVIRYVITESAVTRVTSLWTSRLPARGAATLGEGPARTIDHGVPETVRAPRYVE